MKGPIYIDGNKDHELVIPSLGFQNTGAICYFNALVQCLLSSRTFVHYICKEKQESVFYLFFKFIAVEKKWDPFFTSKLLHVMNAYVPNQSSSEYFLKLCDYAKLDDLFTTKTETITTCLECKNESKLIDSSVYFVINENINEFCESNRQIDDYQCDTCKKKVSATIHSKLSEISPIMVFSFNKYFEKKHIEYPKGFTINNDKEYHLISTVEHHGILQAGHYFSRSMRNGQLVNIDDNSVTKLDDLPSTENTYMAFYQLTIPTPTQQKKE